MTTAAEVRTQFLEFFKSKGHKIVDSAPIVVKNDPSLMFTNAGMNQFKDYFLGNRTAVDKRVADTQKCLRVSGKHNDLEEVGVDTYHHTMFEMLGNWSFGDYFKEEAIAWAWELLTEVYKLDKDRLYVTVFEGDKEDGLEEDTEAAAIWEKFISKERIIKCNKKDNFWEMGDTGPCGPCSEIHMDLRRDTERSKIDGKLLVNADHDQVIELWNLVFIQFNRKADRSLEVLPDKHIDTGMGLERIVRAINGKSSNYDIDLFMDSIRALENISGLQFGKDEPTDIAFRVIADHVRAVCFTIADGQLPSNEKAGYVVRRILRRAIRYGYSFLGMEKPFIHQLVPLLAKQFESTFPELNQQADFVQQVIEQEEKSFLNTLNNGLKLFDKFKQSGSKELSGSQAFELYDTFGFPIDLTQLLARENAIEVDIQGFETELQAQKQRSRADAQKVEGDWVIVTKDEKEEFVGYDYTETEVRLTRYRQVNIKNKTLYQLVFHLTPFYGESGGQVGDKGTLRGIEDNELISIIDTQKENDLIIQISEKLPLNVTQRFVAKVDTKSRLATACNHSATHLLHAALKQVLGGHVNQKGSLVNPNYLRFDFSHFQKMSKEEVYAVEQIVNEKIRAAIALDESRNVPYKKALEKGAMALFGEKYGDVVRVITFDPSFSVELCGGTHVSNTSEIGSFKIVSESSVAAGVRRIEAISSTTADELLQSKLTLLEEIHETLGQPGDPLKAVQQLLQEQKQLKLRIEHYEEAAAQLVKKQLIESCTKIGDVNAVVEVVKLDTAAQAKDLAFQLKNEIDDLFCVLLADIDGKPSLSIMISDSLIQKYNLNAGKLVREWAVEIKGGGGGQAFFAQAGGNYVGGLDKIKEVAMAYLNNI